MCPCEGLNGTLPPCRHQGSLDETAASGVKQVRVCEPRALAIAPTVDNAGDCFDRRDLAERMIPSATSHVSAPVAAARARRHDLDHPSRVVAFVPARPPARMPYRRRALAALHSKDSAAILTVVAAPWFSVRTWMGVAFSARVVDCP
jgi:hypothetical protein